MIFSTILALVAWARNPFLFFQTLLAYKICLCVLGDLNFLCRRVLISSGQRQEWFISNNYKAQILADMSFPYGIHTILKTRVMDFYQIQGCKIIIFYILCFMFCFTLRTSFNRFPA